MDLNLIKYAIRSSWGTDTAYPMSPHPFLTGHPSTGQCAVSAVLLQDYVGGRLQKGRVNGLVSHYWNLIDGTAVDLTAEQFLPSAVIIGSQAVLRESLMADATFRGRYQILKDRTAAFLKKYAALEQEISQCSLCQNAVEKFTNHTISFGGKGDVLVVGEAPAKNGWRLSGTAWKTAAGQTIPSGKRLCALLSLCGLDLFDCNFLEMIKCHPQGRKDLALCGKNCYSFLERQLSLLAPRLILTLGKIPVQMMLSSRAPLEELVGKRHIVTVGHQTFTVFPIYHPSPISPKSWSENLLLIPALQATLKEGESCLSI